jgi:hypothetical protein
MKKNKTVLILITIIVGFILLFVYFHLFSNREGFLLDSKIPKIIWTYWDGDIPDFVKKCIESWHKYNPDYKIVVLNKENIGLYLPNEINIELLKHSGDSSARYSDFVRLIILPTHGGFWMDATIICQTSLDWVHKIHMESGCELVGYYRDNFMTVPEYKFIESWFFACIPESAFVKDWRDEFLKISNYDSVDDYVNDLKKFGIDTQNVPQKRLNYLAVYLSAQAIIQKPKHVYNLQLIKSDNTALKYWVDHGYNSNIAARDLVEKPSGHRHQPLIKIVGVVRKELLDLDVNLDVLF